MAEEKKNELIFSLHDNMTNELICSGNASIYIIKDGKKIVIANKKLTIFPTKVEIEEKYLREKLYIELLDNPAYKPSPFPDPNIATIPICFCRQSLIQSVRFIPKGTYIGIVKAYGSEMGILNNKEEVYLSNWKDETISIAKDQTITLKAFLFYNVEKGKKKSSNRFFLNNDDIENSYSENIYWAFTISNDIFSYKTVDKRDKLKTISATLTLNNTQDRDIRKFSEKTQLNNSINNHHVYKLMRAGKEVTGHTINFSLSDIFSDNLLKNESLRENYYITFFAYEIEEKDKIVITYNETTDNLPLKQLKIVSNKYSMVFDGYNLKLYENEKYIKNFEAKLMLDGKNIDHDSFPFMPLSEQKYIGLDDLYICKLSAFNKVNYVTNQVTDIAHKIMDSVKNNKISDNATTNNMPLDNATSNSIVLDNATTINTTNNNLNNVNYNQDNDSLITNYIRTYMNMLSLSEPQYSIISNDNQKKDNTKNNTGTNTKGSINYIIDEKILHDKDIILQNLHQTNSSNDDGYTKIKNDMIKLNNSILLSSNNFKSLISMLNSQSDILVKFIYQPKYVIEVTRYKEKYNYDTSTLKGRYGATYGVFAVYVYYMGEKFLLDSVIEAYNEANKLNNNIKLTNDNIEEIQNFIKNSNNYNLIQTKTNIKLQGKESYGNLSYGGYTMESVGPDNITSGVKRRLPEGHYKGVFHNSDTHYKNNTMKLYNDLVSSGRAILIHAGTNYIEYTTGCVLVSDLSYEKTYKKEYSFPQSKDKKDLLYQLYKTITNKFTNKLYKHINVVIRNKFGIFGE